MPDFILLMHSDVVNREVADDGTAWDSYLSKLRSRGNLKGGSSIGPGSRHRKGQPSSPADRSIEGFLRVEAESPEAAVALLDGNPNYEAGGTVEVRLLPQDE